MDTPIVRFGGPVGPYTGYDRHRQQHQQQGDEAETEAEDSVGDARPRPTESSGSRPPITALRLRCWLRLGSWSCCAPSTPQASLGLRLGCMVMLRASLSRRLRWASLCASRPPSLELRTRLRAHLRAPGNPSAHPFAPAALVLAASCKDSSSPLPPARQPPPLTPCPLPTLAARQRGPPRQPLYFYQSGLLAAWNDSPAWPKRRQGAALRRLACPDLRPLLRSPTTSA
jgi:hypothetical protein